MKHILSTTALALALTTSMAHAGGLAPIVDEQDEISPIMAAPQSSVSDWIVPIIFLGLVAAAASSSSSDDTGGTAGAEDDGETGLVVLDGLFER